MDLDGDFARADELGGGVQTLELDDADGVEHVARKLRRD
jgi:hypothetical protein